MKKDPRNNADDAYEAFMSMPDSEWDGLMMSLATGGILQPEEHKGFLRAREERRIKRTAIPDYSQEAPVTPAQEYMKRFTSLVVQMGTLEIEVEDLEEKLKAKKDELNVYREKLVPEIMMEMGLDEMKTASGIKVEMKTDVRASLPQDSAKRESAFGYLKHTGNDGLIKREFVIAYGRDSTEWAEQFKKLLDDNQVGEHATVTNELTIHNSSLVAFIKRELKDGRPIPLEAFGAFVQRIAKIKRGGK